MNFPQLDWARDSGTLLMAGAALALLVSGVLLWRNRRPLPPGEVERRRRSYLNQVGRIVEGEILEISELPVEQAPAKNGLLRRSKAPEPAPGGNGSRTVVHYCYSISGVTYETAQDVTGYEERACLESIVAGQPASVKYDPANPGNSILIADDWSGLH